MDLFSQLETPTSDKPEKHGMMYSDGGSRGNPGPAASGSVLYDENKKTIARDGFYCGTQTNNYAEYMGVIRGCELALKHDITHLKVYLDSNLAVEQLSGNWKVKNANIKPLFEKAHALKEQFVQISYHHVRREYNKVADGIVNDVLDSNR